MPVPGAVCSTSERCADGCYRRSERRNLCDQHHGRKHCSSALSLCIPETPLSCAWGGWQVQARKPSWAQGTQQPIRRKLGGKAAGIAVKLPPADAAAVWSAAALGDGAELMDDEELLTEEDRARPEVPGAFAPWPASRLKPGGCCVQAEIYHFRQLTLQPTPCDTLVGVSCTVRLFCLAQRLHFWSHTGPQCNVCC